MSNKPVLIINTFKEMERCIDELTFHTHELQINDEIKPKIIEECEWGFRFDPEDHDYESYSDNELAHVFYSSCVAYCQHRGLI